MFKKFWSVVSIIVILTMMVAAVSNAATVTSTNDFPSTLETSEAADHTIVFTTPSGVDEGETITITFAGSFDTSTITEDDIDIEDDGTDLTTAPDCLGLEDASVSVAADVVTLTICALNGGAIAATSEVTIKVGTNATASGTGVNQITNPSNAGTYFINIAGTFGDSGSIALPMLDAGSIAVEAEVSQDGGGGGGGGGGCGDSTAPTISSIVVSSVTSSSSTISWSTNENADSKVDYGTTSSYEIGTETSTSLVSTHSITLTNLSDGVEYHFRVRSSDLCANQTTSSDQTFTTSDVTDPLISSIEETVTSTTSVTITWTTDEPTTSEVSYGTTSSYGETETDSTLTTEHTVTITGLEEGTTYHFEVTSTDSSGNDSTSADNTFTTEDDASPTNVSSVDVTESDESITITWTNSTDEDLAGVIVVVCTDEAPTDAEDPDCEIVYDGSDESVTISDLTNDTTYYIGVFSYDTAEQFASGALATGTPSASEEEVLPADEEVPPAVTPSEEGEVDVVETIDTTSTSSGGGSSPSGEVPADGTSDSSLSGSGSASDESETGEESPEIPPTTVSGGDLIPNEDISFLVANGAIELSPSGSGEVHLLPSRPLRITLETEHIYQQIDRIQLVLDTGVYIMTASADGRTYETDVSSPETSGSSASAVSIYYTDGSIQSITTTIDVEDEGYVFDTIDGQTSYIGGATLTLLENGTVVWDGSPYAQLNPYSVSDGTFGWYVPNTTYALSADAVGYTAQTTGTFSVTDNIVNQSIQLVALPAEEIVPPVSDSETTTLFEKASSTLTDLTLYVSETVGETLETIREIPGVEETAAVSTPVLAIITTAATVSLISSFDLLLLLQNLFTSPVLLFWKRKRKAYGVVYHAITKVPIDLAVVRLWSMPDEWQGEEGVTGRLIRSRVTDKGGRYFFLAPPGRYRLTVSKVGFSFPSEYLADTRDDGEFLDVYHSEPIEVTDRRASITANIPMDLAENAAVHTPKAVLRHIRLRRAQKAIAISGTILAIVAAVIHPSKFTIVMVVIQIALYLLVKRLAMPKRPKSWGIVYDEQTGRPLEKVIARVFEPKYNKLLETTVTDSKGRYTFLLGPNEYYTVYEKIGFSAAEIRPIDYRNKKEPSEFFADVKLSPEGTVASSQEPSERT